MLNNFRWTRPWGLSVAYGLVVKTFIILTVQRCIFYGILDYRAALIALITIIHIINSLFCIIEYFKSKYKRYLCYKLELF